MSRVCRAASLARRAIVEVSSASAGRVDRNFSLSSSALKAMPTRVARGRRADRRRCCVARARQPRLSRARPGQVPPSPRQAGVLPLDDCSELVAFPPEGCDEQSHQRVNQKSRRRIPAINQRSRSWASGYAGGEPCCSAGQRRNETNSAAAKPCGNRHGRNIEEANEIAGPVLWSSHPTNGMQARPANPSQREWE